jgi:hypothetical protein
MGIRHVFILALHTFALITLSGLSEMIHSAIRNQNYLLFNVRSNNLDTYNP